ncbi:N-acetylmuramoyl-L-alanine amidase [Streptomyces sp. NPDC051976]|uniref:N-acetylmuramoyl-L-alanine amidase n=1 Tax=Streptomyces sp. NPDC051976 TaxID=3154947 RepID=UPI00341462F5
MTSRHRRKKSVIAYGAAGLALATAATYGTIALATTSSGGTGDAKNGGGASATALQDDFSAAAAEFQVPKNVLMAVAYHQTLWDSHGGRPSTTGNYNVMGLTQVTAADVVQPTADQRLAEMNLSGDPAVTKHFDAARALKTAVAKVDTSDPRLHTLDAAAKLIDASADEVKNDARQSVRAGAALLAQYEKAAVGSLPSDAGQWYAGVARYSQSPSAAGAEQFAQRVFDSVRTGESRVTAEGQAVTLAADPSVTPVKPAKVPLAATTTAAPATTAATPAPECPAVLKCNFVPAAFGPDTSKPPTILGNYNPANRVPGPPAAGAEDIRYIIIHDTEGSFAGAIQEFQNASASASAHYVIAQDGRVTQMVQTKDESWHAANKTINMHSIGIEHEGYAIQAGWVGEPEYESSATLVKSLAATYHIPLDREHIIGHDEVPGVLDGNVKTQHWDPGPYFDWNHYMSLLGAPTGVGNAGGPVKTGELVRIVPPFTTDNQPKITSAGTTEPAHPANFVYLYTSPSTTAALPTDPYLGTPAWSDGSNWSNKLVAGGEYVVAGVQTDWTAIWYGGKKVWFHNPGGQWTAPVTGQMVLTPKSGTIPVYGRAYPEQAAYTGTNVPVQTDNDTSLTKYTIAAGQAYAQAGPEAAGDYYYGGTYAGTTPGDRTLVSGSSNVFYPIRYNHRLAWVRAGDVQQIGTTAPDSGATRYDLLGRDSSGVLWQYQGTGSATTPFYTRFRVGAGWQGYNAVTAMTALRADAVGDMVARDTSGSLWYYKGSGKPSAPFQARVKVGGGWQIYNNLSGVRDVTGDGKPDLIARDASGVLWLYQGTGSTTAPFAARLRIGGGWQGYNTLVSLGDFTGDGKADLMARDTSGALYLYSGTGSATAPFAPRVKIGTGWQIYNSIVGVSDLSGDGKGDLVARDTSGKLWVYKGTGSATTPYSARTQVGTGWQIYNALV